MASTKTRAAAEYVALKFEYRLKLAGIHHQKQVHRTDGIAFYFTKLGFVRGVDWTIRISDHVPQGHHKDKPKYYSITYRNIDHSVPEQQLNRALKLIVE